MATVASGVSIADRKAAREEIGAELARRSLYRFVQEAWHVVEPANPFMPNWHIEAICDHLEAVTHGEIRNLLINMPPRSAKSTTVSVMWPMWVWITRPDLRWMFASYALSLAIRDSLKCRRLIESSWYQRHFSSSFTLASDQNLKSRFENDHRGYRYAVSVNSGVTGEGGDLIVCDDPHNVKEAPSQIIREATLDWWDAAISSRLNDPKTGAKVIVMQRVHEEDLSGHVLAKGDYVHLCLPMEYEAERTISTPLKHSDLEESTDAQEQGEAQGWHDPRTDEGQLLWPERFGPAEIVSLKNALGALEYAGQYQQRPSPKGGLVFQSAWFNKRYRELPALQGIVLAVDSAFKEGTGSDYSALAVWATDGIGYYLLHAWRGRVAFPDLLRVIVDTYWRWRPDAVLIEDAASGQSAIQQLRRDTNLPIIGVPAKGSKVSRAEAVSPLFEAGKVHLPESSAAPWLAEWIDEHVRFPRAAHDDQVDTTSHGLAWLKNRYVGGEVVLASTHFHESPIQAMQREQANDDAQAEREAERQAKYPLAAQVQQFARELGVLNLEEAMQTVQEERSTAKKKPAQPTPPPKRRLGRNTPASEETFTAQEPEDYLDQQQAHLRDTLNRLLEERLGQQFANTPW